LFFIVLDESEHPLEILQNYYPNVFNNWANLYKRAILGRPTLQVLLDIPFQPWKFQFKDVVLSFVRCTLMQHLSQTFKRKWVS